MRSSQAGCALLLLYHLQCSLCCLAPPPPAPPVGVSEWQSAAEICGDGSTGASPSTDSQVCSGGQKCNNNDNGRRRKGSVDCSGLQSPSTSGLCHVNFLPEYFRAYFTLVPLPIDKVKANEMK